MGSENTSNGSKYGSNSDSKHGSNNGRKYVSDYGNNGSDGSARAFADVDPFAALHLFSEADSLRFVHKQIIGIAESSLDGAIICIVGESGMGKSFAASICAKYLEQQGFLCKTQSLAGKTSAQATKSLAHLTRWATRSLEEDRRSFLVIDDFRPTDECDLVRQASSVHRLVSCGAVVVLCMLPEAVQLIEELGDVRQIRTQNLLLQQVEDDVDFGLSGGIPSLHFARARDRVEHRESDVQGSSYLKELVKLTGALFRSTLPDEDNALRLAMVLMGSGTSDELSSIVERLDDEALAWLHAEAPVFRVDPTLRTFSCVGLERDGCLAVALTSLNSLKGHDDKLAMQVARTLAKRGDHRRSALVASTCAPETRVRLASAWGIEYLCAGALGFVRESLELARRLDLDAGEGMVSLKKALLLLEAPASQLAGNMAVPGHPPHAAPPRSSGERDMTRIRRHVELLQACRDLDRGMAPGKVTFVSGDDDDLSRGLIDHIEARSRLLAGEFSLAYESLVNNPRRITADSIDAMLLCDDFELASLLIGEAPDERSLHAFERSFSFCRSMGIGRLGGYRAMLEQLVSVLSGRAAELEGAETAIALAEKMGDDAIRACLLLGASIADLRSRLHSRAHVRALMASRLPVWPDGYLRKASRAVDACVHLSLGDDAMLRALASGHDQSTLDSLMRLLACICVGRECGDRPQLGPKPDFDVLWALNLLSNDLEGASNAFRKALPDTWSWTSRRVVRKTESFMHLLERGERASGGALPEAREPRKADKPAASEPFIKIRLLGDFCVVAQGVPIAPSELGRRRSVALLASLAARDTHKMTRAEIVETIWPEYGYVEARQRLYEATSRMRVALGYRRLGVDPFMTSRGEGMLALNPSVVAVDVDDFVRRSRQALATREDARAIELSIRALELYAGDMYVSTFDGRGAQSARRQELRDLYADVAVAAVRAAFRENDLTLASRMARRAYEVCDTREDVAITLIDALKSTGQIQVARDVYRDFSSRLLERVGMPPSASMRRAVESLFPSTIVARRRREDEEELVTIAR